MFYVFYFYILSEIINRCTIYTVLYAKMLFKIYILTKKFFSCYFTLIQILKYFILCPKCFNEYVFVKILGYRLYAFIFLLF